MTSGREEWHLYRCYDCDSLVWLSGWTLTHRTVFCRGCMETREVTPVLDGAAGAGENGVARSRAPEWAVGRRA